MSSFVYFQIFSWVKDEIFQKLNKPLVKSPTELTTDTHIRATDTHTRATDTLTRATDTLTRATDTHTRVTGKTFFKSIFQRNIYLIVKRLYPIDCKSSFLPIDGN